MHHTTQSRRWKLVYSTITDGESWSNMVDRIEEKGPMLVLLREHSTDGNNETAVFGAFAAQTFRRNPQFYGSLEGFLVKLRPEVKVYRASGANENFQYFQYGSQRLPNGIGFGGQMDYFALWLDANFGKGKCNGTPTSLTYGNPPLSSNPSFTIETLEVLQVIRRRERGNAGASDQQQQRRYSSISIGSSISSTTSTSSTNSLSNSTHSFLNSSSLPTISIPAATLASISRSASSSDVNLINSQSVGIISGSTSPSPSTSSSRSSGNGNGSGTGRPAVGLTIDTSNLKSFQKRKNVGTVLATAKMEDQHSVKLESGNEFVKMEQQQQSMDYFFDNAGGNGGGQASLMDGLEVSPMLAANVNMGPLANTRVTATARPVRRNRMDTTSRNDDNALTQGFQQMFE
ncbi:hypothetical protein HDU76_004271, partial [Blyttiomyces sp. JEL0837]